MGGDRWTEGDVARARAAADSALPVARAGGGAPLGRRRFLGAIGAAAAGLAAEGALVACAREAATTTDPPPPTGRAVGRVIDLEGDPFPAAGAIFLLYASGQQAGLEVPVDQGGAFRFDSLPQGDWQARLYAPFVAYVPSPYPHPLRFTVRANETTSLVIRAGRAYGADPMAEIYIGDHFFQKQPVGAENGEAVVRVGTPVCWYNVGLSQHSVVGPLWNSGPMGRADSYVWVADRPGVFPYRCGFHPQMIATLRVTEG